MESFRGKMQPIRLTVFLLLLVSMPVKRVYSQSMAAEPTQTESKPGPGQAPANPETKTAPSSAGKTEASASMTPEEMRHAQLAADTKKLFQLAAELRTEVAKTNKDTLSLTVVKKAEEVEKLAKSIKERMNNETKSTNH
jgi:hypothetical protein